ncbi:MauE/DoxX family redox-associated membrane protein [Flavobacterium sp. C4GT6]|uniref:MauE/DoxX family redox-associated membrane protein n=1 Tax=Flavobacterium sp. C4GT6 TaxID=3103818 RepID=UPI002ED25FE6
MKIKSAIRSLIIETVCCLYGILFVYAAASKLLDFENFRVQLGQSPILGAFAGLLSWLVPILEILISLCLWIPQVRRVALYAAFTLMLMFTAYIYTVLHYSSFVPCSCGGVLEDMGWTVHLYFNLLFVILAAVALLLMPSRPSRRSLSSLPLLAYCSVGGLLTVALLYLSSDTIIHKHNTFIRSFAFSPQKVHEAHLGYNSYYLAGSNASSIFLGNPTVPSLLSEFDSQLNKHADHRVVPDTVYPGSSLHFHVIGDDLFATDGNLPVIYRGKASGAWRAAPVWLGHLRYTQIKFTGPDHAVVRGYNHEGESILAAIDFSSADATLHEGLLQRQIDGLFDVDGIVLYDTHTKEIIYVHYYRNEMIITDSHLTLLRRNTTIDTISKAQIEVAQLRKSGDRMLSAPPLTVNHSAAADYGYIFVQSGLMGRFESKEMWQEASVIDVYQSKGNRYLFSFYVYHIDGSKLRSFIVKDNHLYGLIGNYLVDYQLHDAMFSPKGVRAIQAVSGNRRKPGIE